MKKNGETAPDCFPSDVRTPGANGYPRGVREGMPREGMPLRVLPFAYLIGRPAPHESIDVDQFAPHRSLSIQTHSPGLLP
jgi:hypothetical protein